MSPETTLGSRVAKASDVYAFGITLWELYTGGRAFEGAGARYCGGWGGGGGGGRSREHWIGPVAHAACAGRTGYPSERPGPLRRAAPTPCELGALWTRPPPPAPQAFP